MDGNVGTLVFFLPEEANFRSFSYTGSISFLPPHARKEREMNIWMRRELNPGEQVPQSDA